MLNVAIIGIGNCGNQVANEAFTANIPVFGINSSEDDLNNINEDIPILLFGSKVGAGKDRAIAKSFLGASYKMLVKDEQFSSIIDNKDVVFVVASTGGGTGSGSSLSLVKILKRVYPNKIIIPVGVLPILSESIGAQRNTLEWLKELTIMKDELHLSYMLYDNNKYKDLAADQYMKLINKEIVEAITYIRGDYSEKSEFGMIDGADMKKIISIDGMINVSYHNNIQEKDIDKNSKLDKFIIDAMINNGTVQIDRDRIIKRMGIIASLNNGLVKYYDSAMSDLKDYAGEPLEQFEHYHVSDKNATGFCSRICTICSGLSIPDDRIMMIIQRIKEVEDALNRKKDATLLDNLDSLDSLKIDERSGNRDANEKLDVDELDIDF